jgi:hypothetical protein
MDGGQVALLKGGKAAASVWMSDVSGQRRVFAAVSETGKSPVEEKPIEGGVQIQPDVIALSDGGALVAYEEGSRIKVVKLDEKGVAAASSDACTTAGDQHYADLLQLPDGNVLVAFEKLEKGKSSVVVAPVALTNGDDAQRK